MQLLLRLKGENLEKQDSLARLHHNHRRKINSLSLQGTKKSPAIIQKAAYEAAAAAAAHTKIAH